MKKIILLFLFLPFLGISQSGKVMDNLSVVSKILGMERKYAVYLPPDYYTSERSYPVLYLLHGAGDDHTGWVQFGEVLQITDKAIADGKSTPMIIIMPDADTKVRGYFNSPDNAWKYEDFFFDELIPEVEKKFRIKASKRFRAIAGLSMGGGGSFMYALHRPDMFSAACPLSAYTGPLSMEAFKAQLANRNMAGTEAQLEAYYAKHSATELVKTLPAADLKKVRWFIDCGDDDFLFEGNALMHIALKKAEIPHEYRVRQGGHTWTYWRESLPEVLGFVSLGFHQF
ncbi:MAG: esterase family protein [Saprospiraceae bacterium]|nr:esterase family protein [Saprospiraceae bacterium]